MDIQVQDVRPSNSTAFRITHCFDLGLECKCVRSAIILLVVLAFLPANFWAQTPTCSNFVDQMEAEVYGGVAPGTTTVYLPNPTGAGNAIILGTSGTNGTTFTVTDDGGNTYNSPGPTPNDSNGKVFQIFYALNVAANTRQIILHYNTADQNLGGGPWVMECTNVAIGSAFDGSSSYSSSGPSPFNVTAGSVTPSQSGDLVVEGFWDDYTLGLGSSGVVAAGSQSNINWNMFQADIAQGYGGQWGVYNSTSPLNPTMTVTASSGVTAGGQAQAIFLKAASAGTAFPTSGIRITGIKTFWGGGTDKTTNPDETVLPRTDQFPCDTSNDAVVLEWLAGSSGTLTSVTLNSTSLISTGAAVCNGSGGCSMGYYLQNATTSPTQILTLNGNDGSYSAKAFCIQRGATSGFFDKTYTSTGVNSGNGNPVDIGSITPETSGGLIFAALSQANNTSIGVSNSSQMFLSCLWSWENASSTGCDENNGWAYYYNPNTSAVDFTFTQWQSGTSINNYSAREDAFVGQTSTTMPAPPANLAAIVTIVN
jgi:hypothetical protein